MSWPTVAWLPGATRVPLYFGGLGDWTAGAIPKLGVHTTEGFSIATSESAYRSKGFAPHFTAGPDPSGAHKVVYHQHYPMTSRATTLEDPAGGTRTNRECIIQLEYAGFCDPKYADSYLYIHNWPDWLWQGYAELAALVCKAAAIPVESTVTWSSYPGDWGLDAAQRLPDDAYHAYTGILGHQHVPQNHHGDPGDLDISKFMALMKGVADVPATPPNTHIVEADMRVWLDQTKDQRLPVGKTHLLSLGTNKQTKRNIVSLLWESENVGEFRAQAGLIVRGLKAGEKLPVRWARYRKDKTGKVVRVGTFGWDQIVGTNDPLDYGQIIVAPGNLNLGERLRLEAQAHSKTVVVEYVRAQANYSERQPH